MLMIQTLENKHTLRNIENLKKQNNGISFTNYNYLYSAMIFFFNNFVLNSLIEIIESSGEKFIIQLKEEEYISRGKYTKGLRDEVIVITILISSEEVSGAIGLESYIPTVAHLYFKRIGLTNCFKWIDAYWFKDILKNQSDELIEDDKSSLYDDED